ncbi:MAG: hypothetical protein Kow0029_20530 [Candidatus Rifleibacteriota bacterium]
MKKFTLCFLLLWVSCTVVSAQDQLSNPENEETIVKNFLDCYSIRPYNKEKADEIRKLVASPPCFNQSFLETIKEYVLVCFFPAHYRNSLRECYYCQKIIRDAVEMYNSEHNVKLRRINDKMLNETLTPLIPEYLKYPFPRADKRCHFESIGDITSNDLFIYCTFHGSYQSINDLK